MMESKKLFDLDNLAEMLGGDQKAVLQMIKIFLQATPESVNEMNRCFEKNDFDGVSKMAHKLKSSVDIFSIFDLKQEIRRLENNTRDSINLDEVPELVGKVNTILQQAIKQITEEKDSLAKRLYQSENVSKA